MFVLYGVERTCGPAQMHVEVAINTFKLNKKYIYLSYDVAVIQWITSFILYLSVKSMHITEE